MFKSRHFDYEYVLKPIDACLCFDSALLVLKGHTSHPQSWRAKAPVSAAHILTSIYLTESNYLKTGTSKPIGLVNAGVDLLWFMCLV